MGSTTVSTERRARFKEIARRIVGEDRSAQRAGISQNTIGAIERALVMAFREGANQIEGINAEPIGLTWIQVPVRSRETLRSMTWSFSKRFGVSDEIADDIEAFQNDGKTRWRCVTPDGQRRDHSVADGSVRPLLRLGLLTPISGRPDTYRLSGAAIDLCRDYWTKDDANDPSIPKISLR